MVHHFAMRIFILSALALLCSSAHAQLLVDGRHACLDTQTGTLLATIPESMFGKDCQILVEKEPGWQQVIIEGSDIDKGSFPFSQISAESKWAVTATKDDGTQIQTTLQFTFLPIVRLLGTFGNEYQAGTFIFLHPESATTDTLTAKIKWRGGTTNTANKHKRNYKISFDEDHSFFGLRNDDKWMLDAGQPDVFRLRNRIAMDVWNKIARKPYYADQEPKALNGVRGDIVEMFLGDEWRGIYNLSEVIDRKQLKLKKMDDKTGDIHGCLYKSINWDKVKMFEFLSDYDNTKDAFYGFEMKYPDLEDSDTVDWAPLVTAVNFLEGSTNEDFEEHVGDYFDIPVVMDYNIFFNVVNAVDNGGKNMYWGIYDKASTKRLTPTPWDLDATFGQRWGGRLIEEVDEGFYHSPEFRLDLELNLTYRFYRDNANDYLGLLNKRYQQLRQIGQPLHTDSILAIVDHYYHAIKKSGAASREEAKWSGDSDVWGDVIDFDTEYAYICDWIKRRMKFIDETELPLFYKKSYFDELSVASVLLSNTDNHAIYDLSGRLVAKETMAGLKPGLYIRNGKKILLK